ncbi:MAG: MotA/TolQ/ExbB proton channel family protein [Fibrobacteres bacterium]|nr:MotA/TolQ/ExbB proton channel family protein [Fibrobacterota bacterium]
MTSQQILSMILKSGPFATLIILTTTVFSVITLAVIIIKLRDYKRAAAKNREFVAKFNSAKNLQALVLNPNHEESGSLENISRTGIMEFNRLLESVLAHPKERINSFFMESQFLIVKDQIEKTVNEQVAIYDRNLVLLAITSSVCPLLGLLGTVWGITTSFTAIGKMGQASLSVVAPGIAEALITTIWGIGVAIPAVISYNAFVSKNKSYEDEAYNFSAILLNRIKIQFFDLLAQKG